MPDNNALYIASPLGFSEAGRLFMKQELFSIVEGLGYTIIDPWVLTDQQLIDKVLSMPYGIAKKEAWAELNKIIGANNAKGIDNSRGILAVLDGVDVDSGTAAEIGYCAAQSKPILGYRGDFRLSADNEGSIVNLQVEYFIRSRGGDIVTTIAAIRDILPKIFPVQK